MAFEVPTERCLWPEIWLVWPGLVLAECSASGDNTTVEDGSGETSPIPSPDGSVKAVRKTPDININVKLSSSGGVSAPRGGGLSDTVMTLLTTRRKKELTHEINK